MKWIKAINRFPEKPGIENRVIIRDTTEGQDFIAYGFRNFDEERPAIYFERGNKSFITVNGGGNMYSTWPIQNIEWLDESSSDENWDAAYEQYQKDVYKPGVYTSDNIFLHYLKDRYNLIKK